jgi:hypothetical protein
LKFVRLANNGARRLSHVRGVKRCDCFFETSSVHEDDWGDCLGILLTSRAMGSDIRAKLAAMNEWLSRDLRTGEALEIAPSREQPRMPFPTTFAA